MKKIMENKYIDALVKAVMLGLFSWLIYLMVDVRDFIKYKQPATDLKQDNSITFLSQKIDQNNEVNNEKNATVNGRVDQQTDKVSRMERKLDIIIFKLTGDGPTAYN